MRRIVYRLSVYRTIFRINVSLHLIHVSFKDVVYLLRKVSLSISKLKCTRGSRCSAPILGQMPVLPGICTLCSGLYVLKASYINWDSVQDGPEPASGAF